MPDISSTRTPFAVTAARVLIIEAAVILALWLAGRYFSG
jgi:hypothetical protein